MNEHDIFAEALLRTDPAERAAYLDGVCGPDDRLRRRLEQLLANHEGGCLLDRRAADVIGVLVDRTGPDDEPKPPSADTAARQLAPYLAPAARPDSLGRIGHYEVLQVLGQGGFGIVVKAFDESLHRVVAVKVLAPHLAVTSPPRKRFIREARSAARVRHEHAVQIHAVEEEPIPYLVMEFVPGQTLQQKLNAVGPVPAPEVVLLGRQIALGLAAAHEQGLIHRDVKPANILLEDGPNTRAKLTDFGLARAADDASLTQSGVVAGSPQFMAPEQARGLPLDTRADLFSLGTVLYTMTTGHPPFRARNTFAVLRRVVEDTPRAIRDLIPEAPEGLVAVIARLLEKDPAARYASAREAADALAGCLTTPVPAPRRRGGLAYAAVAAAAVLLLVGIGLGAGAFSHPDPKNDPGPDVVNAAVPVAPPAARDGPKPPPVAAPATGFVVTSTRDDGSPGTLRWAVNEANIRHGEDLITFDPDVFATPQTVTLAQGPLVLIDPARTTITGPAGGVTVSGDKKSQVFVIGLFTEPGNPAAAAIADLTIAYGRNTDDIRFGGGVLVRGGSTLDLSGCTIRDNALHTEGGGGVFALDSTVTLTNCTLTRNAALEGAAVKNYRGVVTATNCTIVDNSCQIGSGIHAFGDGVRKSRTTLHNCLFFNPIGRNVVIDDNSGFTGDYNLSSDDSAPGEHSLRNAGPRLGPLGRYGGPTETIPLLTGSPAADAGSNEAVPAGVRTDQRGRPRVRNTTVDIGAFEVQ